MEREENGEERMMWKGMNGKNDERMNGKNDERMNENGVE